VNVDTSIFKKYDIRGKATGSDAPLTSGLAYRIGQAFGTYLQPVEQLNTVVVGRDNRDSSYDLQHAAMNGLRATGCHVVDIGLVSTPVVYWQAVTRGNIGGLMVTASHLGPEQNGFKLCIGNRNLYGDDIQTLRKMIETDNYSFGDGQLTVDQGVYSDYVDDLAGRIQMARSLKIVVDPGNGTGGLFAPRLFDLWGHDVILIHGEPNGSFPNHQPNPQDAANMIDLGEAVREHGADIGIALDGDADRMGVVDEKGEMIAADRLLALLARDMLARNPGQPVVADVLSSQVLFDEIERAGGVPVMWASGHSLVKAKMFELGAPLGGEMSGHIFLAEDYLGFDDGYFAAGRLLQLLAASDQTMSELDATLPTLYSTPEYRPHCPDEDKQNVIDGVAKALADSGEVIDVDGVRIIFERGWGLLRASNTEPVLSLRFEGETEDDALTYRDLFFAALAAFPQVGSIDSN
jgi:phosphomannomutase/phosphoglucomutase